MIVRVTSVVVQIALRRRAPVVAVRLVVAPQNGMLTCRRGDLPVVSVQRRRGTAQVAGLPLQHRVVGHRGKDHPLLVVVLAEDFVFAQVKPVAHAKSGNLQDSEITGQ